MARLFKLMLILLAFIMIGVVGTYVYAGWNLLGLAIRFAHFRI